MLYCTDGSNKELFLAVLSATKASIERYLLIKFIYKEALQRNHTVSDDLFISDLLTDVSSF